MFQPKGPPPPKTKDDFFKIRSRTQGIRGGPKRFCLRAPPPPLGKTYYFQSTESLSDSSAKAGAKEGRTLVASMRLELRSHPERIKNTHLLRILL